MAEQGTKENHPFKTPEELEEWALKNLQPHQLEMAREMGMLKSKTTPSDSEEKP